VTLRCAVCFDGLDRQIARVEIEWPAIRLVEHELGCSGERARLEVDLGRQHDVLGAGLRVVAIRVGIEPCHRRAS
jgi:hypothetical protein